METHQQQFIEFALQHSALKFGNFTLKSGRQSPYFFNLGVFHDGEALSQLGYFYATALRQTGIECDVLFGPAYKGITLACVTALASVQHYQKNYAFCFNRKEAKTHGEGGLLVGATLAKQRVVIIDDVLTAGTAVREAIAIIQHAGATLAGILVALDRQETGQSALTAAEEIRQHYHVPVYSIIQFSQLIEFAAGKSAMQDIVKTLADYQAKPDTTCQLSRDE